MQSIGAILWRVGAHLAEDSQLRGVVLEGQVGDLRVYPRMAFWKIKDETDSLSCVSFLPGLTLEAETRVRVWGDVGLYRGCCQLKVDRVEQIAERVDPLAEGLAQLADVLRPAHPLPRIWQVGIVSSLAAAGLRDCLTGLAGAGLQIRIYTAKVQGETAPGEIVSAIRRAIEDGIQCLALVRGGGSREDLVAWDHPSVARAVCQSPVPVITGIGHQVDTTLVDLVADLRCITPTDAGVQIRARATLPADLLAALQRRLEARRLELVEARRQLHRLRPDPSHQYRALVEALHRRLASHRQALLQTRAELRPRWQALLQTSLEERLAASHRALTESRARWQIESQPRLMCGGTQVHLLAELGDRWQIYLPDGVVSIVDGRVQIRDDS